MHRIPPLLALLAATLLLMSVGFVDGRPSVFFDTHSYDVMGRDLIETVRDWPASNHNKADAHLKIGDRPVSADRLVNSQVEDARSPYYGLALHGAYLTTSLWGLVAMQSVLAAWVIYLLWRTLAPRAPSWSYLALTAALTVGSSISFFTNFAMPDIFAGVGGAAVVLILVQGDRLKTVEIAGLWAVVAYSMAIHRSHWATELAVAFGGGALLLILGLPARSVVRRVLLVCGAAMVAWSAGALFHQVYMNRTGQRLTHPPFLLARVLADGPGQALQRAVCKPPGQGNEQPYAVCDFRRMSASAELILWSDRPNVGVFNAANWAQRERMEAEEMRFVIAAVKLDPLGQIKASLGNWGQQILAYRVDDPLQDPGGYLLGPYWPNTSLPRLIPNLKVCRPLGACRPPFDAAVLADWHGLVLAASLLLIAGRLSRRDVRAALWRRGLKEDSARAAATVLLLLAVVVVNDAVCGILAGPFNRYEARLIWLLPLAAGLIVCALPMGRLRMLWPRRS